MRSSTIIRKAEPDEIEAFYNLKLRHFACEHEGEIIAMGTLTYSGDRHWAFFTVKDDPSPKEALAVVYALMRGMRRIKEPIYVTSNEGVHERAIKLIRLLGFRSTGEITNGHQVWVFRHHDREAADPTDHRELAA